MISTLYFYLELENLTLDTSTDSEDEFQRKKKVAIENVIFNRKI